MAALQLAKDGSNAVVKRNSEEANDPTKVFNRYTQSYMDKDLYEDCVKPESISANPAEKNQKKRT